MLHSPLTPTAEYSQYRAVQENQEHKDNEYILVHQENATCNPEMKLCILYIS